MILFFFHFQKWWIAVDTLPYIVQPVQMVMEKGGAMENVNGKMDNAYTLIVSIVIITIAITFPNGTGFRGCHFQFS